MPQSLPPCPPALLVFLPAAGPPELNVPHRLPHWNTGPLCHHTQPPPRGGASGPQVPVPPVLPPTPPHSSLSEGPVESPGVTREQEGGETQPQLAAWPRGRGDVLSSPQPPGPRPRGGVVF